MTNSHLTDLQSLIDRLARGGGMGAGLECKRFFSGATAYADNKIFMTLTPVGLALKLPEPARTTLLAAGGKPLTYFRNSPVKKEYVVLPEELADEMLAHWIGMSLRFVMNK